MKKLFTKFACLALAALCTVSFTACGAGNGGGESGGNVDIDVNKTQLYVGLVPSGYGNSWLYKEFERFEKAYADYEFEPGTGKKGVQCILDDISYGNTIAQSLASARYKIVMTQDVNYNDLITKKLILNLNDILHAEFDDTDISGNAVKSTIYDKFTSVEARENYTINGGIYAIPFVSGEDGISYDRDLFEEKGLFFLATDPDNGDYHAYYETEGSEKVYLLGGKPGSGEVLSMGRDGVPGTYDDGLPATYEQFYFLMDTIMDLGMTPITWSGKYLNEYGRNLLYSFWVNNEGFENMRLNYTFDGVAKDLIDIDASGNITKLPDTVIDENNGYLLTRQEGKYQALEFFNTVLKKMKARDAKGYNLATKDSIDHLMAQDNFLRSVVKAETNSAQYNRIAMFHDGAYWENEATSTFNLMGPGYGKKDRKIGWMPHPHPTEEGIGGTVFMGASSSMIMVNANIEKTPELMDVVTKFLQFMNTRESLVEFMQMTSMTRPMDFTMTESEVAEMSYFGQCLYYKFKNSEILDPMSNKPVYLRNYTTFSGVHSILWSTAGEGLDGTDAPTVQFMDDNVTAKQYFRGMQNYFTQAWWNRVVLGK